MKRGALALLALLAFAWALPAAALDVDTLMQRLAARGDASATFEEEQVLAALDRPLRSSGLLEYRAPGRLEKRTLKPRVETLIYENGVAQVERGKRRMTLDLKRVPQVLPLVESIRATLAGDRAALERSFTLALEGDEAHWTLQLTPTDARVRELIDGIRLQGSQGMVLDVEVRQRNGDRSHTTITPQPAR